MTIILKKKGKYKFKSTFVTPVEVSKKGNNTASKKYEGSQKKRWDFKYSLFFQLLSLLMSD